jgi:hypothetical protein
MAPLTGGPSSCSAEQALRPIAQHCAVEQQGVGMTAPPRTDPPPSSVPTQYLKYNVPILLRDVNLVQFF